MQSDIETEEYMAIYIRKSVYDELFEKSFGHRDFSKLTKKQITDKNGHTRNVWVRIGDSLVKEKRKGTKADVVKLSRGSHIKFEYGGNTLTGKIITGGKDGYTVEGTGKVNGGIFRVPYKKIISMTHMKDSNKILNFLKDKKSVSKGWRGTDGYQPESCDTLEGLYKTIKAAQDEFNAFTDSIAKQYEALNPIVMKRTSLKSKDRIEEKLREDQKDIDYKANLKGEKPIPECYDEKTDTYHCRTIRDCDGHTICVNNLEEVANILYTLNSRKEVARLKNNFATPTPVGYSDINANIKLSNGAIVELQVNTTANMIAKERYGHALYEVYRSVESNPKYKKLADLMGEAQKNVYGLSNKYSEKGNYPVSEIPLGKDGNRNIFDANYKHEPYAAACRKQVNEAIPLFEQAKKDGVLNAKVVEHFEHLIEYIK